MTEKNAGNGDIKRIETAVETAVEESPQTTGELMNEVYDKLIGNGSEEVVSDEEDSVEVSDTDDESDETDKDEEHKTETDRTEEKEEVDAKSGSMKAPKDWPKKARDDFAILPEDAQKYMLDTYKSMQGDYTRKTQGIAEVTKALDPIRSIMQGRNITAGQAINQLVGIFLDIHNNPVKGIQQIAEAYKLDLEGLSTYWDDPDEFAKTENVGKNRAEMTAELKPQVTEADRQAYAAKLEEFKEWREDKEFIDQVENKMADLAAIESMHGNSNSSFDDLYEEACWSVPEVKEILRKRDAAGDLEESAKDKRRRAAKAEKAGKSLKTTSHETNGKKEKEPKNTSEAMGKAWDELSGKDVV